MKESLAQTETGTPVEQNVQSLHGYPTKEELVAEMRQAIDGSPDVKNALVNFIELVAARDKMKQNMEDFRNKIRELEEKKEQIAKTFGDGGEDDLKALKDVNAEIFSLNEAMGFLGIRLAYDSEQDRIVSAAEMAVGSKVFNALSIVTKKYQKLVDERFFAFHSFLTDFSGAIFSATQIPAEGGNLVRIDAQLARGLRLIVDDVVLHLTGHAPDIHAFATRIAGKDK